MSQSCKQDVCIGRIRLAGRYLYGKRVIDYVEARVNLTPVTDNDDVIAETTIRKGIAQLGSDTGGFAGSDNEWLP